LGAVDAAQGAGPFEEAVVKIRYTNRDPQSSPLVVTVDERVGDAFGAGLAAGFVLRLTVTIIKRTDNVAGFVVLPRRWVVERTFGWLTRHRRLVRDYERRPDHHEAMVWWASVAIMTRRLTRELAGDPAQPRWGQPRQAQPIAA
jgi:transposase